MPQVLDEHVCSPETVVMLKEAMLEVVESAHGTARAIKDSSYKIAGKTGTAVTALDNKGYNKGNKIYQASFIGYFPADAPKFTVAVVIQNSRESKLIYGAAVSGTVFKEISDKLYARYLTTPTYNTALVKDTLLNNALGMRTDMRAILGYMAIPFFDSAQTGNWRNIKLAQNTAVMNNAVNVQSFKTTPDVAGMGLKDAVYILENKGLKISLQGKGKVISQSIAAGTGFTKGQKITLFLN
jgi:cell division protein FtsI (penicillin-binding protein 3)